MDILYSIQDTDVKIENHHGETREQRLEEFLKINPTMKLVGLREGCSIKIENKIISHIGSKTLRVWNYKEHPVELNSDSDITFLLKS